jgi:hypothetical protein
MAAASTLSPARFHPAARADMGAAMNARARKLIGLVGILVFLAVYIALVSKLSDHVPDHWAARLAFYVVAGTCWGVPILPLISWMNRGR